MATNNGKLYYKKGRKEKYRYPDRVITVKYNKPKRPKRKSSFGTILFWVGVAILGYLILTGMSA